ncbi:MAG: hypothetical protein HOV68_23085, partial [Streptomycetaceae bacterium]|nr:hypothetical protein [Streptomycetaceae bacterium]
MSESESAIVPGWPVVTIEMSADELRIDGDAVAVPAGASPREVALEAVARTAQMLGRPVRAEAVEADGTVYPLIVAPDASVSEAGPAIAPPERRGFRRRKSKAQPAAPRPEAVRPPRPEAVEPPAPPVDPPSIPRSAPQAPPPAAPPAEPVPQVVPEWRSEAVAPPAPV